MLTLALWVHIAYTVRAAIARHTRITNILAGYVKRKDEYAMNLPLSPHESAAQSMHRHKRATEWMAACHDITFASTWNLASKSNTEFRDEDDDDGDAYFNVKHNKLAKRWIVYLRRCIQHRFPSFGVRAGTFCVHWNRYVVKGPSVWCVVHL